MKKVCLYACCNTFERDVGDEVEDVVVFGCGFLLFYVGTLCVVMFGTVVDGRKCNSVVFYPTETWTMPNEALL